MNTNLLHNIINILIAVVAALGAMDWTVLFTPTTAATIVSALAAVKLIVNVLRDGFTGLAKTQPPVKD